MLIAFPCFNVDDNAVIMSATSSQITSLTIVYSTVYSGADQRKHQSSTSLSLVRRIQWWPVNSPHKGPVTHKMFPFDDVIMDINQLPQNEEKYKMRIWTNLCFREKIAEPDRLNTVATKLKLPLDMYRIINSVYIHMIEYKIVMLCYVKWSGEFLHISSKLLFHSINTLNTQIR